MKFLIYILILLTGRNCFSQKFELILGLCPTYSITVSNIRLGNSPNINPTITLEDARDPNTFKTKSIDWIHNKNYVGIEPSLEVGYHVGKDITIGLGFFGRQRQLRYDLYVPVFDGISVYSHRFQLDFIFMASTFGVKYQHPSQKWNLAFNAGFNYAFKKLDDLGEFFTVINNFSIREDVYGPLANYHNFFNFTLSPLARVTINRNVSNKLDLGFMIEKQFRNEYGSVINIEDITNGQTILSGGVFGSDLTLGIKLSYKVFTRTK